MNRTYFFHIVLGFATASIPFHSLIADVTGPLSSHFSYSAEEYVAEEDEDPADDDKNSASSTAIKLLAATSLVTIIGGVVYCWPDNQNVENHETTHNKQRKSTAQSNDKQEQQEKLSNGENAVPQSTPPPEPPPSPDASRLSKLQAHVEKKFDDVDQGVAKLQQQTRELRDKIERTQQPLTASSVAAIMSDNGLHSTPEIKINGIFNVEDTEEGGKFYFIESSTTQCPKNKQGIRYYLDQRAQSEQFSQTFKAIWHASFLYDGGDFAKIQQHYKSRDVPQVNFGQHAQIALFEIDATEYKKLELELTACNNSNC